MPYILLKREQNMLEYTFNMRFQVQVIDYFYLNNTKKKKFQDGL